MTERRTDQMTLVAFMQASNVSVYSGSWRYPNAAQDYLSLAYYQRIARVLEEGNFDLMFFDDRLAMPGIYGNSVADAVRYAPGRSSSTSPRFSALPRPRPRIWGSEQPTPRPTTSRSTSHVPLRHSIISVADAPPGTSSPR